MQNYPPNNPQNPTNQPNYDASYIQHQLSQQMVMTSGVKINVFNIMAESAKRLGKHFGNVFLGWLVYFISFTMFWIILSYLMQLFLLAVIPSVLLSVSASGFTFATVMKIMMVLIAIVIVLISASMIFYFGFLSYISDLIELGSANFGNIFTGFQKVIQIIGFVGMIVIPTLIFAVVVAIPFGFFSAITNYANPSQSRAPIQYQQPEMTQVQYTPYNPPQTPTPNFTPYANQPTYTPQNSNPISVVTTVVYSLLVLVAFLLYLSKLILVPNLLIAQDMNLKEAVKESWNKVQGNTFIHVFLLLIMMGIVAYLINMISVTYVAPAIIKGTKWSLIWYSVVNSLMVQVVFIYFIGCIAHTYNSLYPLEIKSDPLAMASKYSRKTHPKYFQSLQQQNANKPDSTRHQYYSVKEYNPNQGPEQHHNPPQMQQPGAEPFKSPSEQEQQQPVPKEHQNVQEAAKRYKSGIRHEEPATNEATDKPPSFKETAHRHQSGIRHEDYMKKDTTSKRHKSQYISQQPPAGYQVPNAPLDNFIPVSDNDLVPQQEKGHVSKFVDNLFEKEDYPTGKIVPVDAMRMMRDPDVKFIEVHFQNAKHAMNTLKMLPIFINVPDSAEYKIREPLSYSLTMPKIPSNPVKLFFGGKDMTIKELWDCKEIILKNNGNIVRINRGKGE